MWWKWMCEKWKGELDLKKMCPPCHHLWQDLRHHITWRHKIRSTVLEAYKLSDHLIVYNSHNNSFCAWMELVHLFKCVSVYLYLKSILICDLKSNSLCAWMSLDVAFPVLSYLVSPIALQNWIAQWQGYGKSNQKCRNHEQMKWQHVIVCAAEGAGGVDVEGVLCTSCAFCVVSYPGCVRVWTENAVCHNQYQIVSCIWNHTHLRDKSICVYGRVTVC